MKFTYYYMSIKHILYFVSCSNVSLIMVFWALKGRLLLKEHICFIDMLASGGDITNISDKAI
jgi:hypothetical protein